MIDFVIYPGVNDTKIYCVNEAVKVPMHMYIHMFYVAEDIKTAELVHAKTKPKKPEAIKAACTQR